MLKITHDARRNAVFGRYAGIDAKRVAEELAAMHDATGEEFDFDEEHRIDPEFGVDCGDIDLTDDWLECGDVEGRVPYYLAVARVLARQKIDQSSGEYEGAYAALVDVIYTAIVPTV